VEEIRRSAPSVEEAIEAALAELGITEQDALIQVVREPKSGILGIGSQEAEVLVRVRRSKPAEADESLAEQGEIAADFVDGLVARIWRNAADLQRLFQLGARILPPATMRPSMP